MEKYLNPALSPDERAKDLLGKMSLDEKMAQVCGMWLVPGHEDGMEKACEHGIGQVSTLWMREMETLDEVVGWQRKAQEMVLKNSEHGIPAAFHMEGLCGAFIQDSTSFPSGIGRGSSWNPELEEKVANVVGRQELACGITQVLAPVLDISRDSRMGRQGETYGEDPTLAAAMGCAYTKGIQEQEVAGRKAESVAKHFLGFHGSYGGIHGANAEIGDRLLDEVYGKPFQAAIAKANLRGVMPCYCSLNGEPLSSSRKILTGLLRDEMGFDGVVVADYSSVANVYNAQHASETLEEAGKMSMEAGVDVELPSREAYNDELKAWFADGRADMEVLDRAVLRVLRAKFRMGLFEHPFALDGEALREDFVGKEDMKITKQSALESMVLLKNNGVLPLAKGVKKIAVVGTHAANARIFFGGYTHVSMEEAVHAVANSIAGLKSGSVEGRQMLTVPGTQIQSDETEEFDAVLRHIKPKCKSLLEVLREKLPGVEITYSYGYAIAGDDLSHIDEALVAAKDADVVLMTLGGKHGSCSVASMGEGVDATDINLPVCQDAFIRAAAKLGKPLVGVHFNGRPISSDAADECLDAILEAWNPAETGAEAIAEVLLGEYNPGGKLPVSVARNAGQIPIYYNHPHGSAWHQGESIGFKDYVDMPHTPRYFFGHGLSYTTFEYKDLKLSAADVKTMDLNRGAKSGAAPALEIDPLGAAVVELTVENTGKYDGDEVVQLYLCDSFASVSRPVKELAGFSRVHLKTGEKRTVRFTVRASQTAFLDREMKWKIEKGEIEVQVGSSSEDIRLADAFMIGRDAWIEGRERAFYAEVEVW